MKHLALIKLTEFNNQDNIYYKRKIDFKKYMIELKQYTVNNFAKKTNYIYDFTCRKFLELIGNKNLNNYSISDFENYKEKRLNQKISITSLNIELRCLKAIFNYAYTKKYLISKIGSEILQLTESDTTRGYFNKSDLIEISNALTSKDIRNIVFFAYYTGCRINEILNLKWENIDFINRTISIENTISFKTKTRKNRIIPISLYLFEILNTMRQSPIKSFYIFEYYGKPFKQNHVSKTFKRTIRKLRYPETLNFHCLRHSFITNLINAGIEINTVKELAGHTCLETTLKYCHSDNERKRKAIDCL